MCELADNCPDVSNSDQTDSNGNGTGDACEALAVPSVGSSLVLRGLLTGLTMLVGVREIRRGAPGGFKTR